MTLPTTGWGAFALEHAANLDGRFLARSDRSGLAAPHPIGAFYDCWTIVRIICSCMGRPECPQGFEYQSIRRTAVSDPNLPFAL